MANIFKNRTVRPSTRLETSTSYKIDTKNVTKDDLLIVTISHESKSFRKSYKFNGADIEHLNSISFNVSDKGASIDITWSRVNPIGSIPELLKSVIKNEPIKNVITEVEIIESSNYLKKSFSPISNSETSILILGSMPGDKSLKMNEYYGHPRNRFWKILSAITASPLPLTYTDKTAFLLKMKIGVWDVAHKAYRKGSLDSNIQNEVPNDLTGFILKHKKLKVIGFNGKLSKALFDKYFKMNPQIKYIVLPSSSPANNQIDFKEICNQWNKITT